MRLTHGDTGTRLYRIWKSMKCRCLNSNHPTYKYYGARGVKICDDWLDDYAAFKNWAMSNGYDAALELDRIDVNGNYEPANCRWITHHEQSLNLRNNSYVECEGERIPLVKFLNDNAVPVSTYYGWRSKGVAVERLSKRVNREVKVTNGPRYQEH